MPKVLLTQAAKEADHEAKLDKILSGAVGRYMGINGLDKTMTARKFGYPLSSFSSRIKNTGGTKLKDVRKIAHACGMTPEEWLQLGGFSSKC